MAMETFLRILAREESVKLSFHAYSNPVESLSLWHTNTSFAKLFTCTLTNPERCRLN